MNDPLGIISNHQAAAASLRQRLAGPGAAPEEGPAFKEALLAEIRRVNELQVNADRAIDDFASGSRDDIENVMLATQKADTAFRMLLQVRNKVMDAYEEVKQIRV